MYIYSICTSISHIMKHEIDQTWADRTGLRGEGRRAKVKLRGRTFVPLSATSEGTIMEHR